MTPPVASHITTVLRYDTRFSSFSPDHSPFYLLHYHVQRLRASAEALDWPGAREFFETGDAIAKFRDILEERVASSQGPRATDSPSAWRIRVLMDRDGGINADIAQPQPLDDAEVENTFFPSSFSLEDRPEKEKEREEEREFPRTKKQALPWVVYADTQATHPSHYTRHKTTERTAYAEARSRGVELANLDEKPSPEVEVLLWNPEGEVMEGCITSVYFHRPSHPKPESREEAGPVWITPALAAGGNDGTTRRYALEKKLCREGSIRVDDLVDGETYWLSNGGRGFWPATFRRRYKKIIDA